MIEGMERLVRGQTPPPAAATLIGMALTSFAEGEATVRVAASDARQPHEHRAGRHPGRAGRRCHGLGLHDDFGRKRELHDPGNEDQISPAGSRGAIAGKGGATPPASSCLWARARKRAVTPAWLLPAFGGPCARDSGPSG